MFETEQATDVYVCLYVCNFLSKHLDFLVENCSTNSATFANRVNNNSLSNSLHTLARIFHIHLYDSIQFGGELEKENLTTILRLVKDKPINDC